MKRLCFLFLALVAASASLQAQPVDHPLNPLTWQEYWTVLEVLRDEGHLDADTRFSMVNLQEPAKDLVRQWKPGDAVPRNAYALVRQGPDTYEATVDLTGRRLSSWTGRPDIQPNWLASEFGAVSDLVKENEEFVEAMRRRGFEDLTFIDCGAGPPGYFDTEEQRDRRVAHVNCADARGVRNSWTRQIEGLTVVVDMHERTVLRVVDEGVVPVPTVSADYDPASLGTPRDIPGPIAVDQPLGPGFVRDGYQVDWQNWHFHVRPDQRTGMILSTVTYRDGDDTRSVLYQGNLAEIFVPYMDPAFSWYARNFLDAGEYTAGGLAKPLLQGLDCPDHAEYIDALVAGDRGRPMAIPRMICIFERETGDMSWRHWAGAGNAESRRKRDLVVRSAAVLGNYDYVFDWIFQQNGSITVAVGATGIAESKMVVEEDALSGSAAGADAYGRFVDPHVVAVNHDHYFSFRLDMDVDGTNNSLQIDRLRSRTLPADHPRRSVWVSEPMVARRESDAKLSINLDRPALWRVTSASRTNHVGYPTSYQLMPGKTGKTLLSEDDYPRRRAGFIDYHLWVTPYSPEERYPAGDHPTLSKPGYGLPAWTAGDRSIEGTDIVLWHTIGMHHMVRAEDWPVMPVLWHSFELRPFDFFDRNPAMDLPR